MTQTTEVCKSERLTNTQQILNNNKIPAQTNKQLQNVQSLDVNCPVGINTNIVSKSESANRSSIAIDQENKRANLKLEIPYKNAPYQIAEDDTSVTVKLKNATQQEVPESSKDLETKVNGSKKFRQTTQNNKDNTRQINEVGTRIEVIEATPTSSNLRIHEELDKNTLSNSHQVHLSNSPYVEQQHTEKLLHTSANIIQKNEKPQLATQNQDVYVCT